MINRLNISFNKQLLHFAFSTNTYPIILGIICLCLFIPRLDFPFLWDDIPLIQHNDQLNGLWSFSDIITGNFLRSITNDGNDLPFYRPFSLLFLAIEQHFWGTSVSGYRFIHFSLHSLSTILLYFFIRDVLRRSSKANEIGIQSVHLASFVGTLFFLSQPFAVDSIFLLSNIGDVIVLLMALCAYFMLRKFKNCGRQYFLWGYIFCISIAVFSKETGVAVPFVLFVITQFKAKEIQSIGRWIPIISVIPILICYFGLRAYFLDTSLKIFEIDIVTDLAYQYFSAFQQSIFPYPTPLMKDLAAPASAIYFWMSIIPVFFIGFVSFKRHYTIFIAIVWWVFFVTPSILGAYTVYYFSPRYLYIPAVGLSILISYLIQISKTKLRLLLFILPLIFYTLSIPRIDAWRSNYSLWKTEIDIHPDNPIALINLGLELRVQQKTAKALTFLLKGRHIAKQKNYKQMESMASEKIGILLLHDYDDISGAEAEFRRSIQAFPSYTAWRELGILLAQYKQNYQDALYAFLNANQLKSNNFQIKVGIAGALGGLKRFDEAYRYLDEASSLIPKSDPRQKFLSKQRMSIKLYETQLINQQTNSK